VGIKTSITLKEINILFPSYHFVQLISTSSGVVDTTYIVLTEKREYILKKYERDIPSKIIRERELLKELNLLGLNTPLCLDEKDDWFLYKKLEGDEPTHIAIQHIKALARFLSIFHRHTFKRDCDFVFMHDYEIEKLLYFSKINFFYYYKKFQFLKSFSLKNDGLIHGDIFKDNTVFQANKIGVFDFIDSGCGSFVFECAVAYVGFGKKVNHKLFLNLFLSTYNQKAPKKISKEEFIKHLLFASRFYALLRIKRYENTKKARELL
jgi:homoserine kinase type II